MFKKYALRLVDFLFEDKSVLDYTISIVKRLNSADYVDMSGAEKFEAALKSIRNDAVGQVRNKISGMSSDEQRMIIQKAVMRLKGTL